VTRDELVRYCLAKPGAWLDEPWEGDEVAKVDDKIFTFFGAVDAASPTVGLKCGRTAEEAGELRAQFPGDVVISAYTGRHGWNTIKLDGGVPDDELREVVDLSYDTVVAGLPRSKRP